MKQIRGFPSARKYQIVKLDRIYRLAAQGYVSTRVSTAEEEVLATGASSQEPRRNYLHGEWTLGERPGWDGRGAKASVAISIFSASVRTSALTLVSTAVAREA
jgi:hypothetical protein